jgi:hypothetical protein
MTATVFNSPEPLSQPAPSEEPTMVGNPVLMRANGARRGPPVRTIASIAVLALAAAGGAAAILHHRSAQVAQPAPAEQLATQASPAVAPTQAAPPVVEPGPAPAGQPAAAPHRLASNQRITEPLHRRAESSSGGAPSVDQNASDTSATAPLNSSAVYSPSASQNAANAAATVPATPSTVVIPAPVAPYAATPASPSPALQNPATIPQPPAAAPQPSIPATPPESSPPQ